LRSRYKLLSNDVLASSPSASGQSCAVSIEASTLRPPSAISAFSISSGRFCAFPFDTSGVPSRVTTNSPSVRSASGQGQFAANGEGGARLRSRISLRT